MKQEARYRCNARNDYAQFSQFIAQAKASREGCASCGESRREDNTTQNRYPVGMVYGVNQQWTDIYETEYGFPRGTIFKELDLPLYRTGCNDKGGCRG